MNDQSKEIILYAYIDKFLEMGYQDYPPYKECLKLTTITEDDYLNSKFNTDDGCNTQAININKEIIYSLIFDCYPNICFNFIKIVLPIIKRIKIENIFDINELEDKNPAPIKDSNEFNLINFILTRKKWVS